MCGIPPSTMHGYLAGTSVPKLDHIVRIVDATVCDPGWLLTGRGEPFVVEGPGGEFENVAGSREELELQVAQWKREAETWEKVVDKLRADLSARDDQVSRLLGGVSGAELVNEPGGTEGGPGAADRPAGGKPGRAGR